MIATYRIVKYIELLHAYATILLYVKITIELKDIVQERLCGMSCYFYKIVLNTIFDIYGCSY